MDECFAPPTTPAEWLAIAEGFFKKWQFPNCCGALDGKHIACKCPPGTGSMYHNYKGFFSMVLFALVDSDYKFIWADIGGKGSASDAQYYIELELKTCLEDGTIGFPDPQPLPHDTEDVSFFWVGDDAFALRPNLMKPYAHRHLTDEEWIFTSRLSPARRVVENAFGILANRFQVLLTTMQHSPRTV
ncbi:protein ALP1-like [Thalassophryne amazonica]|uniref:protein ALP1-like n=1 Tax=Thalassophryne amazonica TaxID=390379 RepID=UPI0014714125|nr:protein ALP1-like [Thalassophryne amazonica]